MITDLRLVLRHFLAEKFSQANDQQNKEEGEWIMSTLMGLFFAQDLILSSLSLAYVSHVTGGRKTG